MRQTFEILKRDDELRLVWGWALVAEEGGRPVVDHQGDVIEPLELLKAANDFMSSARVGGVMHVRGEDGKAIQLGEVVQSIVFTREVQKALGVDLGRVGWFVGVRVASDAVWSLVKRKALGAFSIGGSGVRTAMEIEEWAAAS